MAGEGEGIFDLGDALGATEAPSVQKITIYLPNKDREGNLIPDIEDWISAGMQILADINLGVTRLPWAKGIWRSEDGADDVSEDTTLLYSYLRRPETFVGRFNEIKSFLDEFGRETRQGELMVEFFGEKIDGDNAAGSNVHFRIYSIRLPEQA
jgi:hypothetical protein